MILLVKEPPVILLDVFSVDLQPTCRLFSNGLFLQGLPWRELNFYLQVVIS